LKQASTRSSRGRFAWPLPADASAIPAARHAFEAWLRENGASADDVHDMAVVLSELASNAALGAAPGTTAHIQAGVVGDSVELEVRNQVDSVDTDALRWDLDDPLRGGGRGLLIVRAYTDTLEVDSAGGAVIVRCRRRLEGAA
jgi:anti-sigma regulatory factor (Ser/Thr protein kinase)